MLPFFNKFRQIKNFFSYNTPGAAGPSVETNILADWNRDQHHIFIMTPTTGSKKVKKSLNAFLEEFIESNGQERGWVERRVISTPDGMTSSTLQFKDAHCLKSFFYYYLFPYVQDDKQRIRLTHQAFLNFHQGGLPHAANHVIQKRLADVELSLAEYERKNNLPPKIEEYPLTLNPISEVCYTPTVRGVVVHEKNIYPYHRDDTEKRHPYRAKVEARSTFNAVNDYVRVEVYDTLIDSRSKKSAPIFDQRTFVQKLKNFFQSLLFMNRMTRDKKILTQKPPKPFIFSVPLRDDEHGNEKTSASDRPGNNKQSRFCI